MKTRKSFAINRISFNQDIKHLHALLQGNPYDDAQGFGITSIEVDEQILSAVLIKRNYTFIKGFDIGKKEFEKNTISVFMEIPFSIDFKFKLLYTKGMLTHLLQVKSLFRNLFDFDFQIAGLEIAPSKMYEKVKRKRKKFEIHALTIERFIYNDGAVGKYSAKITNFQTGEELIKIYNDNVSKIVLSFNNYQVHYLNNNTLGIISETDEANENFEDFKNLIK